jgi:hypothetical protein
LAGAGAIMETVETAQRSASTSSLGLADKSRRDLPRTRQTPPQQDVFGKRAKAGDEDPYDNVPCTD